VKRRTQVLQQQRALNRDSLVGPAGLRLLGLILRPLRKELGAVGDVVGALVPPDPVALLVDAVALQVAVTARRGVGAEAWAQRRGRRGVGAEAWAQRRGRMQEGGSEGQ
jgi:hypothetical protein